MTFDPERRPGVANLIRLHCLAADKTPEEVVEESDGLTTAQYKVFIITLKPAGVFQNQYASLKTRIF